MLFVIFNVVYLSCCMYHFNHWLHCNKYLILSYLILYPLHTLPPCGLTSSNMPAPLVRGTLDEWNGLSVTAVAVIFHLSLERPIHISRLWSWIDKLHLRTWPVSSEDVPAYQKWSIYVNAFESESIINKQTDATIRIKVAQPLSDDCLWSISWF